MKAKVKIKLLVLNAVHVKREVNLTVLSHELLRSRN